VQAANFLHSNQSCSGQFPGCRWVRGLAHTFSLFSGVQQSSWLGL
jgi:hypothetical protein